MIGKLSGYSEDRKQIYIDMKEPYKGKIGDEVNVSKRRSRRRLKQNNFYWAFLTWCIERGGLKQQGHWSTEALHGDIKTWAMTEHKTEYKGDFSTADLGILEFVDYFNLIERELMNKFFGIDTSPFLAEYQAYRDWRDFQDFPEDATFKQYLEEKM